MIQRKAQPQNIIMRIHYLFSYIFILSSCAIHRAPSRNMLAERSDYTGQARTEKESSALSASEPLFTPQRTQPEVTDIWIHPHEMPTGDYFRGGWIRTIISDSKWTVKAKGK